MGVINYKRSEIPNAKLTPNELEDRQGIHFDNV